MMLAHERRRWVMAALAIGSAHLAGAALAAEMFVWSVLLAFLATLLAGGAARR